jgi:CRP-like cAMP-binding protein
VKGAVLDTLREIPGVLVDPSPSCRTLAFDETSVRYQVRFFVRTFEETSAVQEQLYTRLWYRFEREGIEIPLSQRVVHTGPPERDRKTQEEILGLFTAVDMLGLLQKEELEILAQEVVPRRFGAGERVITEGEPGNTFYVVAAGRLSVRTGQPETEVADLGPGHCFGEMSLLTGEPRSASVVARNDVLLYEVLRPTFARVLERHPGLAQNLADLLAHRRSELRAAAPQSASPPASGEHPEARRIFTRLRELFRIEAA